MMTVNDIVSVVRRRLGDMNGERWSDDQLILYTSMCQTDICIFTNYDKKIRLLAVYEGIEAYKLPPEIIRLERVEFAGYQVPMYSRYDIDSGKVRYPLVVKDDLPRNILEFRYTATTPGIDTKWVSGLENIYGVTSQVDWSTLLDKYGVVSDIDLDIMPDELPPNRLGYLTLFYSAIPEEVTTLDEELILPNIWKMAFIHYVCGMALGDDNDANNIERGEIELKKYQRMLQEIFIHQAKDATTNYKDKLQTRYRTIGD